MSASWEETLSQIRPHLYVPEGPWDCFSPCAPTVPHWGSWSCTPCLQSCSGVGAGCGSAGDAQHVGARLGNAMDIGPQNVCVSKFGDKGENHSNLRGRWFQAVLHSMALFSPKTRYFPFSSLHIFCIVPSKPLIGATVYTP